MQRQRQTSDKPATTKPVLDQTAVDAKLASEVQQVERKFSANEIGQIRQLLDRLEGGRDAK